MSVLVLDEAAEPVERRRAETEPISERLSVVLDTERRATVTAGGRGALDGLGSDSDTPHAERRSPSS